MAGWEGDGDVDDFEKTIVLEAHKEAFLDSKSEFCSTMLLYKELGAMANMFATEPGTDEITCFDSM